MDYHFINPNPCGWGLIVLQLNQCICWIIYTLKVEDKQVFDIVVGDLCLDISVISN